tara:strand:- start:802 stop:1356 length:555 start_codon:yes stop_codon:yes gene_type:complete
MEAYSYDIKIPHERVAVLIGKDGAMKKKLETETKTSLDVDSKEGNVNVSGKDAIQLYAAREIVSAIGRGFNPDVALRLLKADYAFELIQLADYARNKHDEKRLRGRVIGSEGKSRRLVEELTQTDVTVYGKTVGIIGEAYNVTIARRAVVSLLNGSTHAKVYKWLEQQRKKGMEDNSLETESKG